MQNDLFDVGADLCTPVVANPEYPPLRIEQEYVDRLEGWCDHYNADLPTLRSFILNGGTPGAAQLHVARTVVRRAERSAWAAYAEHGETMNKPAITYLNRLSDLLFILARYANREQRRRAVGARWRTRRRTRERRVSDEKKKAETRRPPEPVDDLVVTHHTLRTTSGEIAYTARTGRIVLREEEVSKKEVFRAGRRAPSSRSRRTPSTTQDVTPRPITFVFNGGPGSSSVWLHMGLLGPRRVDVGDVDAPTPPPYALLDNAETLLAVSDLVFIDPMSTGHSRAVEGRKAWDFHGYAKDVEQVTELIRLWCTREDRWMSPKYLIGESYGTVRAVAVAERLSSKHALSLNGLVLVSSVLDFGSQDFEHLRHDEASLNFLPTYAAIAHYHGLHEGRTLDEVRAEAEEFAAGPYRTGAGKGHRLSAEERAEIVVDAGPAGRASARSTSTAPTCASSTGDGAPRCSATAASPSAASTGATPVRCSRGSPRTWTPTRPSTPSRRRSPPPCTTTCAASSAAPSTCPTRCSPTPSRSGRSRSSRASRSTSPTSSSG